jgi:hypothetical protein
LATPPLHRGPHTSQCVMITHYTMMSPSALPPRAPSSTCARVHGIQCVRWQSQCELVGWHVGNHSAPQDTPRVRRPAYVPSCVLLCVQRPLVCAVQAQAQRTSEQVQQQPCYLPCMALRAAFRPSVFLCLLASSACGCGAADERPRHHAPVKICTPSTAPGC